MRRLVLVDALADAFAISNRYAPEHLILALRQPRDWLAQVEAAGSVFLGDYTPEALGDYCSGTNHVLPTSGAARAYSGVSVASFQNFVSVQSASRAGIAAIGDCALPRWLAPRPGRARQCGGPAHGAGSMSASVLDLVRPDLRGFAGAHSVGPPRQGAGEVWLPCSTQSPWANPADPAGKLPSRIRRRSRSRWARSAGGAVGCSPEQLLDRARQRRGYRPAGARAVPPAPGCGAGNAAGVRHSMRSVRVCRRRRCARCRCVTAAMACWSISRRRHRQRAISARRGSCSCVRRQSGTARLLHWKTYRARCPRFAHGRL